MESIYLLLCKKKKKNNKKIEPQPVANGEKESCELTQILDLNSTATEMSDFGEP